jgi:hypothetical protein
MVHAGAAAVTALLPPLPVTAAAYGRPAA